MQARASYTCEHVLPTRARTCVLHVRARYLIVRARLLFKNVRPGQLKIKGNAPKTKIADFTTKIWLLSSEMTKNDQKKFALKRDLLNFLYR